MKLGDAPNQYFFRLVQAKRIRETIKILTTPDGGSTEDEGEILNLIFDQCCTLC